MIAFRRAASAGRPVDRHVHAGAGGRIVDGVEAVAAVHKVRARAAVQDVVTRATAQRVGSGTAAEAIVARTTLDQIVGRSADERIVIGGSDHAFDGDVLVTRCVAADPDRTVERHVHAIGAAAVIDDVDPVAAVEQIRPAAAQQAIVASATPQGFAAEATAKGIGEVGPDQHLDAGQGVAERLAGRADGAVQRHGHGRAGRAIVRRIDAAATGQGVRAVATGQQIVPGAAVQEVIPGAADQGVVTGIADQGRRSRSRGDAVVEGRTDHLLDAEHRIAFGIAAATDRTVQTNGHATDRGRVVNGVEPGATVDDVGACSADQRIVASVAIEAIGGRAAAERVIAIGPAQGGRGRTGRKRVIEDRTRQVLDRDEDIALGVAAGPGRAIEADLHRGGGRAVIDRVAAQTAVEHVRTGPAVERIVAGATTQVVRAVATGQAVIARTADQRVVGDRTSQGIVAGRTDQDLDRGQAIALRVSARREGGNQVDVHGPGRSRIVRRVDPRTAVKRIRTRATDQGVIATGALKPFGGGGTHDAVFEARADDVLDAVQRVAGRVAAQARGPVEIDGDPCSRSGVVNRVEARAAVQRIGAGTAQQQIVAAAAAELIVPRRAGQGVRAVPAFENIRICAAGETVGIGRADQPLDAREHVALGVATCPDTGIQRHVDRAG